MRYHLITLVLLGFGALSAWAEEQPPATPTDAAVPDASIPVNVPLKTEDVVKEINAVNPYQKPKLSLKLNDRYANTSEDASPYGGVEPFKRHFLLQMEYAGAGRSLPEPEDLKTVKIGFVGPIMSTVSVATGGKSHEEVLGIKMLQGAQLAIEHANAAGGYSARKIPFELITKNDNGLWGATGNEIINMTYKDKVWAILGTVDGANTHIAIRVALKLEIPMMNSGDLDPTLMETNIPWIIRCVGDDRQQGYMLVDYLYKNLKLERVGIIRASNRYGRFGVREINDGSRRLGHPISIEMAYKLGTEDFSLQLERIKAANVQAVVHWGDATEGALILNQMRAMGMKQPYFACDRCTQEEFLKIAGENAEGVVCGYPWNPDSKDEKLAAFRKAFLERFGEEPETYAAHTYDGMNMLIWGIQTAGLNRAKVRDVIAYRSEPFPGVTGEIPLSAALDDEGEVFLTFRENGKWVYKSRAELVIPQ
jgi:ABC-type branched-subunit amino acid transport system substrate-binding protein